MSDTILGGDITVYYLDENRQKRLQWTGAATGTRTANELYSAMANLLDEATTGDDATAMTAETPVEYTIGLIDANDADPWFIAYDCMEHIVGGAVQTSGWTHIDGSAVGLIIVPVTAASNNITTSEYGLNIAGATTGNGTLLEILSDGGTNDYLVIRPDTNAAGDNFTTNAQTITCNALTAPQAQAGSNTGEQVWANLYNVLPVDTYTHWYLYHGTVADGARARIYAINDNTQDWWGEGDFDRCVYLNDIKSTTLATIDSRFISVFARRANTLYDSFELQASASGGRNPVPLKPSSDSNHTTGYRSITLTGGSGNFNIGDEIQDDTNGARGIITLIENPGATATLHYYLIGDPQTDFDGGAITNNDDTGAATGSSAPVNQGPALATWFTNNAFPSITIGNNTSDINDDATTEGYGVTVDCNSNPLTEVYEWLQHQSRNGNLTDIDTGGGASEGEIWIGPTVFLKYSGTVAGGTIVEGDDVTQAVTGATGIVLSHDTTKKELLLRQTRGSFSITDLVTSNDNSGAITADAAADTFNAFTDAPFGRLAGGRFFGARGTLLTNYVAADENNFQLIDAAGVTRTRPISISLSISNLVGGAETAIDSDRISMHRLTGANGAINKTEYSAAGGEAQGAATLTIDGSITADTAGKSAGGWLNIRDVSDSNKHYMIRFSSWTGSTFTLANFAAFVTTATTTATQITYATGGFTAGVKRGDLVMHTTKGVGYVESVDSDTQLTLSGVGIATLTTGDTVEINAIPMLAGVNTLDDVYVSLIDGYATGPTASTSIVYVSPMNYRVKVSNTRNATKIKRFVTDDVTNGGDRNVATIRNEDTIHI